LADDFPTNVPAVSGQQAAVQCLEAFHKSLTFFQILA